jgi:hypothetical protein
MNIEQNMNIEQISKLALTKAVNDYKNTHNKIENEWVQERIKKVLLNRTNFLWSIDFYFLSDEKFYAMIRNIDNSIQIPIFNRNLIENDLQFDAKIEKFIYTVFKMILEKDPNTIYVLENSAMELGVTQLYATE